MLKLEGFEVATALSAEAGLELADNVRPDAIILDMRMPITNGLQFLRMVRAEAAPGRGARRDRDRRLLPVRAHPARAQVARRVDPLQAALARRPDRARQDARRLIRRERSLPPRLPARAGRRDARLVHAPGRPLHGRLPRAAPALLAARDLRAARSSPSRSRCSRSTPSRSTRRSCSPICCCPSRRWGSTSISSRAKGRRSSDPIRDAADVERLRDFEPREALAHVLDTIRLLRQRARRAACR